MNNKNEMPISIKWYVSDHNAELGINWDVIDSATESYMENL